MKIVHVDDGGDGRWLAQNTLPSLHTVGPAYASYQMIEDSFLDIAVNQEDLTDEGDVAIDDVKW